MAQNIVLLFLLLILSETNSFLFNNRYEARKWDGLKVRFGVPARKNFYSLPRTTSEATDQGFTKISDCDAADTWKGARYVKDDDFSLVLLYDVNGFIAGIQTAIPSNQYNGYPNSNLQPPFVKDDKDRWILSSYFVDPGVHYFYKLRRDMDCGDFFPVFPMYNKGHLTGFGWALITNLPSPHLEHAHWSIFGLFMSPVPKCVPTHGRISSLHIYLTKDPLKNVCFRQRY